MSNQVMGSYLSWHGDGLGTTTIVFLNPAELTPVLGRRGLLPSTAKRGRP